MNDEIEELKIEGEEKKEKSKWEKFKEAWKDPKKHALIVLGIWGILFVLAIIFVNLNFSRTPVSTTTSSSPLETFKNMQSYEFNYTGPNISLNGMTYDDKYLLYVNNEKYYKNNVLYKMGETTSAEVEPEILKIDNQMIYDLISNLEPVKKDGYEEYTIPLITFMQSYENSTQGDANSNIIIDLYEKDNKINKVVIDLTSYYQTKGITTNSYILTISYYNINNLSDFTDEYDEMIGVKE